MVAIFRKVWVATATSLLVVTALLAVGGGTSFADHIIIIGQPPQPPEPPQPPAVKQSTDPDGASGCILSVDNPHESFGSPGGYDVKTRVECSQPVRAVELNPMLVFRCPNEPTGTEGTWPSQGCALINTNSAVIASPTVGARYTRQVVFAIVPPKAWSSGARSGKSSTRLAPPTGTANLRATP